MTELRPRYPFIPADIYMKTERSNKCRNKLHTMREKGKERKGTKRTGYKPPSPSPPAPESASAPPSMPSFIWVRTSRHQWPPESPSPLVRILPRKTAQRSARVCICPLSSPSPFPPPSTVSFAGLSTGFSGGRGVPASGPLSCLHYRTTSIYSPLGGRTVSGKLQWVHAHCLLCRTW